jgi:hypothetical protein
MALLGLLSASFSLGVARAYQVAPSQIIATFDYSYLAMTANRRSILDVSVMGFLTDTSHIHGAGRQTAGL